MRTLFLTIFQGVEAKNILRTRVYRELIKQDDVRLVFFVKTQERSTYYEREFSSPRVIYEVMDYRPRTRLDRLFSALKFHSLLTPTTDLRRRMDLDATGNWIAYGAGLILNRLLARPAVRRLLRWLDFRTVRDGRFGQFFDRYRPDAVFLAHLFDDAEIALLAEAKRRSVPTVGFVNSWDKLTARATMRLLPDRLLVYNDIVKEEAIRHADMRPSDIAVVGIPQYDRYAGYRPSPREAFMQRIGIDPAKRFFIYAPMGEAFSSSDWDVIDMLFYWTRDGTLPPDVEFLVRFQPNDAVPEVELSKRPWLRFDRPGTRFQTTRGTDWDMSAPELERLADTLAHMSLLVCYASSMSVDAAAFGKPVINIDFEIRPAKLMRKRPTQFYAMEHYKKALASGGIRRVRSPEELSDWIKKYLEYPAIDAAGRERLVREQCGALDGRAGERIAGGILDAVRRAP